MFQALHLPAPIVAYCPAISGWGGGLLPDLSGFEQHGTFNNMDPATDWVGSGNNYAIDFDGTDDFVAGPVLNAYPQHISIHFWILVRTAPGATAFNTCFASNTISGLPYSGFDIRGGSTTTFEGSFAIAGANPTVSMGTLTTNTWTQLLLVYDGVAIRGYNNGQLIASTTATGAMDASNNPINLSRNPGFTSRRFNGQIADFAVFPTAISPAGAQQLFANGPGGYLTPVKRYRRAVTSTGTNLTANGITAGAPVLGTPSLTQNHVVTATPPSVAAPTTGTPALTQNHAITATPPSVAAPTTGTPSLSQNHTLTATPPSIGAPVLGTPSLAGAGQLLPNGITAGSPTLGTPSLSQNHTITATPPTVGAPTTGTAVLRQNHVVVVVPPSVAAPTLGTPTLSSGGSVSLTPRAPVIGSPVLGRPVLTITESAELSSSDYAFLLLLDREGRDVSYINPDGSTSTFKAVVHKQKHVQRQDDYGIEEQMHRDVSFLATNARGRAYVLQYAEMRIDGIRYQVERYSRNAGRWRCTLKRVEVNEAARPHRRGRQ